MHTDMIDTVVQFISENPLLGGTAVVVFGCLVLLWVTGVIRGDL